MRINATIMYVIIYVALAAIESLFIYLLFNNVISNINAKTNTINGKYKVREFLRTIES